MEIRALQNFLEVAGRETISGAAKSIRLSQPALSRQLRELEDELGQRLFLRGNRKITLTEAGMLLRRRAREIVDLTLKTKNEIMNSCDLVEGEVHVGGVETQAMRLVAKAAQSLRLDHPLICVHLYSGNADDVTERLDKGLLDFGLIIQPAEISKYDFIKFPVADVWGALTHKDNPLAKLKSVKAKDLFKEPLIIPRRGMVKNELTSWFGEKFSELNIAATYNLIVAQKPLSKKNL